MHQRSGVPAPVPAVLLVVVAAALVVAGCGGDDGDARFEAAAKKAVTSTTTAVPTSAAGSGEPSRSSTAPATPTAVALVAATPGESLLAAVAAYQQSVGADGPVEALQLTAHFPVGTPAYASLQSQDPDTPANVDERGWRNGMVGSPSPVRLSGDGTLAENLFPLDSVDWNAIAAAMAGVPQLVEQKLATTLENSDGVTHVIAEKDLPFSPNTVVRVYVDGGDRTSGGYVQYRADGTLDKVQA